MTQEDIGRPAWLGDESKLGLDVPAPTRASPLVVATATFVCLAVVVGVVIAVAVGWRARADNEQAPSRAAAQREVAAGIKSAYGATPVPGQESALPWATNSVAEEVWLTGPLPDGTMRSCQVSTRAALHDVYLLCRGRGGELAER